MQLQTEKIKSLSRSISLNHFGAKPLAAIAFNRNSTSCQRLTPPTCVDMGQGVAPQYTPTDDESLAN